MHGLQHYIPSIKLFGSLKNISTEIGERLHITECKNLYRASNKKKDQYAKQVCTRLTNIERFNWLLEYNAHKNGTTYDARKRVDARQHEAMEYAERPPAMQTFAQLAERHHAVGLERALLDFLRDYIDTEWYDEDNEHRGEPPATPFISSFTKFPVWYNVKFYTPDLQTMDAKDTRDVAYAAPQRTRAELDRNDPDATLAGRFSPVYIKEGGELAGEGGTEGTQLFITGVSLET